MIPSSSRTTLKYLDNSFTQVHLLILPSDWISWSSGLLIAESIHSSRIIDRSGLFLVNSKYWVVFIRNSKLAQTHPINNLKCNSIKIPLICHCRKNPTLPTREPTAPCKQTKLSPKHSNSPPLSLRGESRARDAAIHRVSEDADNLSVRFLVHSRSPRAFSPRDDKEWGIKVSDLIYNTPCHCEKGRKWLTRQSTST